ncbi:MULTISPECIES: MBL fold metallo-hydrolase [unclassified Dietzia]|uniref:MBL fold metallo-hydrolase n=1 Tax=unclassified Dietzia TaxID=2617939 RepID=UPI0015FC0686|nr:MULTISPECIES: MBL fold metallo-hydrolase [unclassified Dietzia]MBB1023560.1 MBL fold metallo-hydrolase [Dietzia sp. DQ12-76]MBB1026284.1 MBL fold metallo-hydrolase [Dietzia sp. DQ11-38-2]
MSNSAASVPAHITLTEGYSGRLGGRLTGERWTVGPARLSKISVGEMDNNVYVIESVSTGEALLVDAANDAPQLIAHLETQAPGVREVVTTHLHADHWIGLPETVEALGLRTIASPGDAEEIHVPTDRHVSHGDEIVVGDLRVGVIGLRGHTPDGIALLLRTAEGSHLFAGDSLFPGGPGKTATPEQFATLMDDLETRVFGVLDDDVVVHPGHGDDTTLGDERPSLRTWRERGW